MSVQRLKPNFSPGAKPEWLTMNTGTVDLQRDDRISPAEGFHRWGTILKLDKRRARALVQWDGESVTSCWNVTELIKENAT